MFCLRNDWTLFLIQISCSNANLELIFFTLPKRWTGKRGNGPRNQWISVFLKLLLRTVRISQTGQVTSQTIAEPFSATCWYLVCLQNISLQEDIWRKYPLFRNLLQETALLDQQKIKILNTRKNIFTFQPLSPGSFNSRFLRLGRCKLCAKAQRSKKSAPLHQWEFEGTYVTDLIPIWQLYYLTPLNRNSCWLVMTWR